MIILSICLALVLITLLATLMVLSLLNKFVCTQKANIKNRRNIIITEPTINGIGVPYSFIKVYKDGVYFADIQANEFGQWSFNPIGLGIYIFK